MNEGFSRNESRPERALTMWRVAKFFFKVGLKMMGIEALQQFIHHFELSRPDQSEEIMNDRCEKRT